MENNVGLTFSVGDTTPLLQSVLSKIIRIGGTKYHTSCTYVNLLECKRINIAARG